MAFLRKLGAPPADLEAPLQLSRELKVKKERNNSTEKRSSYSISTSEHE